MKKKILVRGPVLSQSGYGEQARFALEALKSRPDLFEVFIHPITWGQTGWIWEQNEFREWIDERISLTHHLSQNNSLMPDASFLITIPNEWQKIAPINIGFTAGIETNKVAPVWLEKGNEMDKIVVVSNHAKNTYKNTTTKATVKQTGESIEYSLQTPIDVVNYSYRKYEQEEIKGFELKNNFNFLIVSQWGPRKNMVNAIRWWVEEFIDKKVGLVIKTNFRSNSIVDCEMMEKNIGAVLSEYPERKCSVHLLHGDLSQGQMSWLYGHEKIKCLVNIAHGEGFGLPMFEAAAEELPIVTIGWSGQLDFLSHNSQNYFSEVKFDLQPVQRESVWEGVVRPDSVWAYAQQGSYKMKLRDMHKNWKKHKQRSVKLRKIIEEKFAVEKQNDAMVQAVLSAFPDSQTSDEWLQEMQNIVKEYE